MASKLTPEDITGKLLQGSFTRAGTGAERLADPIADTPMYLTLDELSPYENNPRTVTNPKYQDIKDSIRERGLDQPPPVTRRPGQKKFIIRNGGNTRLSILKELYSETQDDKYFRIHCLFRPWEGARGEIIALTGHLAENDLHGQLMFIERAVGIDKARMLYEKEVGETISQRELSRRLRADGYPISQSHISKMQDAVRCLLPVMPGVLYSGLGKHQVEKLLALRKSASQTWQTHTQENPGITDFDSLFQDVLAQFDGDASEFVFERVQDELISQMKSGTSLTYERILLDINENQSLARRSALIETQTYVTPQPIKTELESQPPVLPSTAIGNQQPKLPGTGDQSPQTPESNSRPPKPPQETQRSTNRADLTPSPPVQPELSDEERQARIDGHVVTPVTTTERVLGIKRQVAALDGEMLPDFRANALVSIPVQVGGLHPISDVWYIERDLDTPDELRKVISQLAREIAVVSGLAAESVEDVPGGLGFMCNEPPVDMELSSLSSNTLTLLQAISGVYAIALTRQNPETPLDVAEFEFTAALGQLLLGSPRYEDRNATAADRLEDAAVVKLFRLIRLGRRLVDLEARTAREGKPS